MNVSIPAPLISKSSASSPDRDQAMSPFSGSVAA